MKQVLVLPLKTVRNPRDLGSYVGADGRKIKTHRLLRTGRMWHLNAHDQQFLQDYGLVKVIDLRSPQECQKEPDPKIAGVQHYNLSLSAVDNTTGGRPDLHKILARYRQDQTAAFQLMCNRYRAHVLKPQAQASLRQILKILAQTKTGAVLYHCSEGKDRTGIVTLLVLYLLGVNLETIRQDYLFSNYLLNDYRAQRDQRLKGRGASLKLRANARILGSVANAFFDAALLAIHDKYDGLDSYVRNQLGITPKIKQQLQDLYLEKK